ncbi:MAG: PLDc N-terminal domain-containing protein [archaeon]
MVSGAFLILPAIILLVMLILGLVVLVTAFWIWMIVDAATRKFKTDGEKIAWVIIVVFLHLLGALIYYFVVKNKDKK